MVVLDLDLLPPNAKIRSERGIPCYFVLDRNSSGGTQPPDQPASSLLSLDLPRPRHSPPGQGGTARKPKRNYLLVLRRRRDRLRRLPGTQSTLPVKKRDSMLCCGQQKDQGRDIPPNAEPAASPRRLQFGQIASTLPHQSQQSLSKQQQPQGVGRGRDLPPMVLQRDFRKVSGISSEVFKQIEAVENDHDATTAAALDAVERRGEMLVRMLDPRNQFSRARQELVRRFVSMQDGVHTVHFVEIVKRPGQTLGLYIREGNGFDRYEGVFISRIAIESAVFNSGCLGVGDEILAVNLIDVTHMSLDDVVIIMSIPRRLVLTIRQQKGQRTGTGSLLRPDSAKPPPVVVIKKELEDDNFEESNDDNNIGHGPHSFSLSHSTGSGIGRGRMTAEPGVAGMSTQGQRLFAQQMQRERAQSGQGPYSYAPPGPIHPTSIQSLPRYPAAYQHYANFSQIQMNHSQLPDVTDYTPRIGRQEEFRLGNAMPKLRKPQYSDYFDPTRPEPPPRPSTGQGSYASPAQYDWYGTGPDRYHHAPVEPPGVTSISYQPPPPVITEQPRSMNMPAHYQSFDRAYPKTLESLAEKVHTFYTGPRPVRQGARSQVRMPRTGSDHRLSLSRDNQSWYGSMPRQRPSAIDYRAHPLSIQPPRFTGAGTGLTSRLSVPIRRKPVLDYASDSEAMTYAPSLRSSGLALPASTRRSLGLTNGRSNSLPRDFVRGGRAGGRKSSNIRFEKRLELTAGRRALLLASGMDSQEESDGGATSAPESSRKDRDYRAWLTRAPSTSAIYERLKTSRDVELLQTQRAAKFNYSAENLSILDRARQRTEREIKRLHEDIDRENQAQAQLSAWEASEAAQLQKDQPSYYTSAFRSHGTALTGGDSTLARALAGRSPSASSALASLGLRDTLSTSASFTKDSLSAETLSRLGLSTSRSRDLLSAEGRTTPTSALLQRLTSSVADHSDKDGESGLRKELLNRSLLSREFLTRDPHGLLEDKETRGRLTAAHGFLNTGRASSCSTGTSVGIGGGSDSRLKLLTINPSEFIRYKIERPSSAASDSGSGMQIHGHSGILRVHLLAGRALRSTVRTTDASVRTRDLYCVLECDRVHKARTVVCTGDQNFDWDETFELDLVNNKELDFLIYSWDPQLRHRLCYKGSVNLVQILSDSNPASAFHQLAIKVEPRGTLYVKLKHTPPQEAFRREIRKVGIFGADLGNVVIREDSGLNVPLIVQKCIEEIERRGLDIIGLYRLCGSATKKQILRESFERSPRTVDLSAENVPDINVIAGVLKDYLRELPEPLLTKCLYQMLVDALSVCLPDDPEGNARLLFSIIECLPKPNRCTLLLILEHLSLVCSLSDRNKMGPTQLAICFGPILMIYYDQTLESLDFQPPIKVLQYLLEVWPAKSVTPLLQTVREAGAAGAVRKGPILLGKGRPFPRSSPASTLLSKSPKTISSSGSKIGPPALPHQPILPLSPSKQSPGSHSESSPSPTSKFLSHHQIGHGALDTLTPSTTSSSLTSVTTPNSLTPVSSTAKSITPATTSNYSLTSELSTTPTPTTGNDIFTTVSVRSRVSAFEVTPTVPQQTPPLQPPPSEATEASKINDQEKRYSFERDAPSLEPEHQSTGQSYDYGEELGHDLMCRQGQDVRYSQEQRKAQDGRYSHEQRQGHDGRYVQDQRYSQDGRYAQEQRQGQERYCQEQRHGQEGRYVLEQRQSQDLRSAQEQLRLGQDQLVKPKTREPTKVQPIPPSPFPIRRFSGPSIPGHVERRHSIEERERRRLPSLPTQQPSLVHQYSLPASLPPKGNGIQPLAEQSPRSLPLNLPTDEKINGQGAHDSGSTTQAQPKQAPAPPPKPKSKSGSVDSISGGSSSSAAASPHQSNSNGSASSSPSWATTVAHPPIQTSGGGENGQEPPSPGTPAKVGSPTPASTPPPVPPRLDRRPSQPSPTSSPPAMPPPVPPRLGRAAPVRTPSLDSREAFEVDCYTIKEENGEEDYLT